MPQKVSKRFFPESGRRYQILLNKKKKPNFLGICQNQGLAAWFYAFSQERIIPGRNYGKWRYEKIPENCTGVIFLITRNPAGQVISMKSSFVAGNNNGGVEC